MDQHFATEATDLDASAWLRYRASLLAPTPEEARADLEAILVASADHAGAIAALRRMALASGDTAGLVNAAASMTVDREDPVERAEALRGAQVLIEAGRNEDASALLGQLVGAEGVPAMAAASLAAWAGSWNTALQLLAGRPGSESLRAWISLTHTGQAAEAASLYAGLLDGEDPSLGAALGLARAARRAEDSANSLRAYQHLASHCPSEPVRAAHDQWAAELLQADGEHGLALGHWRGALSARSTSELAFSGVRECLVSLEDAEGLGNLFEGREAPMELAQSLERAGDADGAVSVYQSVLEAGEDLSVMLVLERLHASAERWQDYYDTLTSRRGLNQDPEQVGLADAQRRWVLAEKLSDSEAAWGLYQQLHADAPSDREVTEALARIAGARGETPVAVQYLHELAEGAEQPSEAARYMRRVGEAHESAGDVASARQSYFDALDHVPDDHDALDGLKKLAIAESDHAGLISVLQREAALTEGDPKVEILRQIARVTEEELGDTAIAVDAWRAVTDLSAADAEAHEHLMALGEERGEHGIVVESGKVLAGALGGEERGAMLHRMGLACEGAADRDAILFFEQAVANEPPHRASATQLEQVYRRRSDWNGVVRSLNVLADTAPDDAERAEAYLAAARVEVDTRHDRELASVYYAKVLEIDDSEEESLRFMASFLFEAGRFEEALPVCRKVEPVIEEGQDLDDFDVRMELSSFYFYLGEMLRKTDEHDEAVTRYERALDLNPTHLASLEAVGPLYFADEQWKKAERVYRQLLQLSGGHGDRHQVASTYTQLGMVEKQLGNLGKAEKRFAKALEIFPNHVGALKGLAMAYQHKADWNNLLSTFNSIIRNATAAPEDVVHAYMTKGIVLDERMARPDKAAQHYKRCIDFQEGKYPLAFLRLAELALRRDDADEAGRMAAKAVDQVPSDDAKLGAAAHMAVAFAAAAKSDSESADAAVSKARELDGEFVEALGEAPLTNVAGYHDALTNEFPT